MAVRRTAARSRWLTRLPLWQGNLFFFLALFFLVVSYFLFQVRQAQNLFVADAREHARLVTGVLRLHVKGAMISGEIIKGVITRFLNNTADFLQYLDGVEPFTRSELEAYAGESGFRGILLVHRDGTRVAAPAGWLPPQVSPAGLPPRKLQYFAGRHLVVFRVPATGTVREVLLGIDAAELEAFHRQVGLPQILSQVTKLRGIRYIRKESGAGEGKKTAVPGEKGPVAGKNKVVFKDDAAGRLVAEVRQRFGRAQLVVGVDAEPLRQKKARLWRDFLVFSLLLALLGGVLSLLLYHQQLAYLAKMQEYDRRLARQREDAALGRSAAAIAHEIRNPLNAMAIALQRLSSEARGELSGEHLQLVKVLLDSVKRTDAIVEGLLRYAGMPQSVSRKKLDFSALVQDVVALYQGHFAAAGIEVSLELRAGLEVAGDRNLLAQVLENVFRNAGEAQPRGGRVGIALRARGREVELQVSNPGKIPGPEELERIFSPYVTLKARGTGLGLAMVRKIVQAHEGTVTAAIREDEFVLVVRLPLAAAA